MTTSTDSGAAWQLGYDRRQLDRIVDRFGEYNRHALSRFNVVNGAAVARGLRSGQLQVHPWGCIQYTVAKAASPIVAYHDVVIGHKSPGDYVVDAFAVDDAAGAVSKLCRLAAERPCWVWVWQESDAMRAVVEAAGYRYMGSKITALAEIRGLYFSGDQTLLPRAVVQLDASEYVGIARTILRADVGAALGELGRLTYADHYSSYNVRRSWSALSLRGYSPDPAFIVKPDEMSRGWKDAHNLQEYGLQDTELRAQLPAVDALHRELTGIAEPHRIRLMRLAPGGGELRRHSDLTDRDSGIGDGRVARFHLPLVTNADVAFTSWDMRGRKHQINMRVGEWWYLDTRKPHAAVNRGATARIHLVVDVVSNPAVRALLEEPQP